MDLSCPLELALLLLLPELHAVMPIGIASIAPMASHRRRAKRHLIIAVSLLVSPDFTRCNG
jgi:hypothetical protein